MQGVFFRVDGADLETGEETYLVLQAASVEEAETVARKQGLLIAGVRAATAADWGAVPAGVAQPAPRPAARTIVFEPPVAAARLTDADRAALDEPERIAATTPIELAFGDERRDAGSSFYDVASDPHDGGSHPPAVEEAPENPAEKPPLESLPIIELSLEVEAPARIDQAAIEAAVPDISLENLFEQTSDPSLGGDAESSRRPPVVDIAQDPEARDSEPAAIEPEALEHSDSLFAIAGESAQSTDAPGEIEAALEASQPAVSPELATAAHLELENAETSFASHSTSSDLVESWPQTAPPVERKAAVEQASLSSSSMARLAPERAGIFADNSFAGDMGSWAVARPAARVVKPTAPPAGVVTSSDANDPPAAGPVKVESPAPRVEAKTPASMPVDDAIPLADSAPEAEEEAFASSSDEVAPTVIPVTAKPVLVPKSSGEPIVQRVAPASRGGNGTGESQRSATGNKHLGRPPVVSRQGAMASSGRGNGSAASGIPVKPSMRRPMGAPPAGSRNSLRGTPPNHPRRVPPSPIAPQAPAQGGDDAAAEVAELARTPVRTSQSQELGGAVVGGSGIEQVITKMALDQAAHAVEHSTGSALERLASSSSFPARSFDAQDPAATSEPIAEALTAPSEPASPASEATSLRAALVQPDAIPIAYARPRASLPAASPLLVYVLAPLGVLITLVGIGVMIFGLTRPLPADLADLDKVDFRIQSLTQAFLGGMLFVAGLFICIASGVANIARRVKALGLR